MNHKRKRPRRQRAGCKMCKYWKLGGISKTNKAFERFSDHKRRTAT